MDDIIPYRPDAASRIAHVISDQSEYDIENYYY